MFNVSQVAGDKLAKSSKILASIVVAAGFLTGAFWYGSPFLALYSMKVAVDSNDPEKLNSYIDYPKLRDSIKGQLAASLVGADADAEGQSNDLAKAGKSIGAMIGLAMADAAVDALVRPEVMMRLMREGVLERRPKEKQGKPEGEKQSVDWDLDRVSMDRLIVRIRTDAGPSDKRKEVSVVMDRTGFADWKMTELRVPL